MAQITGLSQYRSNALNGAYASPARAGKIIPLDLRNPRPGKELSEVSSAGDTVKLSQTASTRAEVQAANTTSQKAQAGVTTARAVGASLNKTARLLGQMRGMVTRLEEEPKLILERGKEAGQHFAALAEQIDLVAESETFAGHKVLDGSFKVSFSVSENSRVTIDATLPTGKSYSTKGLGLDTHSAFLREAAAGSDAGKTRAARLATAREQLPQLSRSLEVAASAVDQVRAGVDEAAGSMVDALHSREAPFGPPVNGATELARRLVAVTQAKVLANGAEAMRAQANISESSALRLMG